MTDPYDPIKDINEATLCLHCIHHKVCWVHKYLDDLADNKIHKETFGYFHRTFGEIAEQCRQYKRNDKK